MSFSSNVREEIEKIKTWDNNSTMKQEEQIKRLQIRQAFLECGFVNDPQKSYHLEMNFKTEKKAQEYKELLSEFDINAKIIAKGKKYVLYMKDSEEISNFLALIGASVAVIKFEEARVLKDTINNVNRRLNCENANLDKIINASIVQIDAIDYLNSINKMKELPDILQEIAYVRKKNPDLGLKELGEKLSNPIGKSAVNYRLKRIVEIAKEYKNNKL